VVSCCINKFETFSYLVMNRFANRRQESSRLERCWATCWLLSGHETKPLSYLSTWHWGLFKVVMTDFILKALTFHLNIISHVRSSQSDPKHRAHRDYKKIVDPLIISSCKNEQKKYIREFSSLLIRQDNYFDHLEIHFFVICDCQKTFHQRRKEKTFCSISKNYDKLEFSFELQKYLFHTISAHFLKKRSGNF